MRMSEQFRQIPLWEQGLQIASRRRYLIALALVVPMAGAVGLAAFMPRSYRSTAIVVVERTGGSDEDVDARLSVLKSENLRRSRLKALIERFHLYQDLARKTSRELLIDQMQKDIRIESDKEERSGRNVVAEVHVTYTAHDPRVAAAVANELAAFYETADLQMREQRAAQTRANLQEQLTDARRRLDEQEARLMDFKMRHLNELPEQVGLHLAALERLNAQIRASQGTPSAPKRAAPVEKPAVATERDARLDQLRELETRYTAEHPDVKRLKREIAARPFMLPTPFGEPEEAIEPASTESAAADAAIRRARVQGIRQRISDLRQTAAIHERGILNAPFRQQELEALLPDYVAARTRYQSLWEKYEVVQLSDPRNDGGRLRVLDPAVARDEAVAPSVTRILAAGIALSLAAMVGVAVAAERMDTSFHTLDDLRAFTGVPVLARVPRLVTVTDRRREVRTTRRFVAVLLLLVALVLGGTVYLSQSNPTFVTWMRQGRP